MFKYNKILWFSLAVLLLSLTIGLWSPAWMYKSLKPLNLQKQIQKKIDINEKKAFNDTIYQWGKFPLSETRLAETFVFKKQRLLFWTSNKVDVELLTLIKKQGVYKLASRFYIVGINYKGDTTIYQLYPLKNDFDFENEFLNNQSLSSLALPDNYYPSYEKTQYTIRLRLNGEDVDLYFKMSKPDQYNLNKALIVSLLYILSLLVVYLLLFKLIQNTTWSVAGRILVWVLVSTFVWLVGLNEASIPFADQYLLFKPYDFANHYIPSLGVLIIHVVCLIMMIRGLFTLSQPLKFRLNVLQTGIVYLLLFGVFILIEQSYENMIVNSTSNFVDFDKALMRFQDIVMLALFGVLMFAFIQLVQWIVKHSYIETRKDYVQFAIGFFTPLSLIVLFFDRSFIYLLLALFIIHTLFFFRTFSLINKQTTRWLVILWISVFVVVVSDHFSSQKELSNRSLHLENYETENNRLAEYLLEQLDAKLSMDSTLFGLIYQLPSMEDYIYNYIKMQYFTGYWSQYTAEITICASDDIFEPPNDIKNCQLFFDQKLLEGSKKVGKTHFASISDFGLEHYLSKYEFALKNNKSLVDLYILFKPKEQQKNLGYPSILLSKDVKGDPNEAYYSFAKYIDGLLVSRIGTYNYATEYTFPVPKQGHLLYESRNYIHLIEALDDNTFNIISAVKRDWWNFFIVLSYVFILFAIIVYLTDFGIWLFFKQKVWSTNLKDKLRWSFIAVLVLTFVVLALSILIKSTSLTEQKQENILSEKQQSVRIELNHKLEDVEDINTQNIDYLNYLLTKFSNVFFTDINLFDLNGNLIASSRPEVFEKGLIGKQMDEMAYFMMNFKKRSNFIHHENIGTQEYLSAYIPLHDKKNKTIAYLNLPYFAKDKEIKSDVSTLITAFLNIFVLLFLITGGITVFISNRITKPLADIQQKLKDFRLEQKNEPIQYSSKDEIGDLVKEYNRTVEELNKNVALLAQKEREGAWKEMAKQIAHEIKNPLTPMKLSLQHLKYIWKDNRPDNDQKLNETIDLVVHQIDQLAEIAGAFSDFSKMTQAQKTNFNLVELINEQIQLNASAAQFELILMDENSNVFADRKQINRVLQNLISNAVQACTLGVEPKIKIHLSNREQSVFIEICDNGSGMDEATQKQLFEPNFTTKTSGMGLGLAIVKQIIDANDGSITFETQVSKGTCFKISLPKKN
ncbi:MAG: HAMP domain-containing histidine kinase [Bacteroidales bacterium]|nr:HAMP domain-containing histidine kinase [Bacteroidales bacterium]